MRIQKPVKNRKHVGSGVIPKIREHIEQDSARFDVSKSFVIAVILAEHYGIKSQQLYK